MTEKNGGQQLPLPLTKLDSLTRALLSFAEQEARDLPWRRDMTPYRVWVSEIMLQQTRTEVVRRYYPRFLEALPDVSSLADADGDALAKLWEGLGYYRRASLMQRAARIVKEKYGGELPADYRLLRELPGFGDYTAGAVASFAFGLRAPAVDGNLLRVLARLFGEEDNVLSSACAKRLSSFAWKMLPPPLADTEAALEQKNQKDGAYLYDGYAAAAWNQAMMELGAQICLPNTTPHCESCPLSPYCVACAEGSAARLPVRITGTKRRFEEKTVLQMMADGYYVLRRRPDEGLLAGLYEFPNVQGTLNSAQAAEEVEKLGFTVMDVRPLPSAKHVFTHITWLLTGYQIEVAPDRLPYGYLLATEEELHTRYSVPGAFNAYKPKKKSNAFE